MSQLKIPAVSRELEFIATHADEAEDIRYGKIKIDPRLKHLSDAVYLRADSDAAELLNHLKDAISEGAIGVFRIDNWHKSRDWEVYSEIYSGARGRKKTLGWIGLHVGYGKEGFRLIGFMKSSWWRPRWSEEV